MKLGVAKAFDRIKKKTDKAFVIILIATLLMAGVVYTLVTCGNTWLGTRLAFTHLMVLMWLALYGGIKEGRFGDGHGNSLRREEMPFLFCVTQYSFITTDSLLTIALIYFWIYGE